MVVVVSTSPMHALVRCSPHTHRPNRETDPTVASRAIRQEDKDKNEQR